MDEAAQFEFNSDAIGHVLADRRLAVPIYQRSYSWGEDEVEEFWHDLRGAFRDDGETLVCVIAQDRGKTIETPDNRFKSRLISRNAEVKGDGLTKTLSERIDRLTS